MKAAGAIVANIFGTRHFVRAENRQGNALFVGKGHRIAHLRARQAGGIGQHRHHGVAQFAISSPSQEARINPAGIRHQQASQGTQAVAQKLHFAAEILAFGGQLGG